MNPSLAFLLCVCVCVCVLNKPICEATNNANKDATCAAIQMKSFFFKERPCLFSKPNHTLLIVHHHISVEEHCGVKLSSLQARAVIAWNHLTQHESKYMTKGPPLIFQNATTFSSVSFQCVTIILLRFYTKFQFFWKQDCN